MHYLLLSLNVSIVYLRIQIIYRSLFTVHPNRHETSSTNRFDEYYANGPTDEPIHSIASSIHHSSAIVDLSSYKVIA